MAYGLKITGFDRLLGNQAQLIRDLGDGDKILRTGVQDLYAQVSERIQQRGELTNGAKIGGGKYSKGHARARRKSGRQTGYIDLTLSGDMLDRGFIVGPTPRGGWGLGFANQLAADRADWNKAHFGEFIKPSDDEKAQALVYIKQAASNVIRNANR